MKVNLELRIEQHDYAGIMRKLEKVVDLPFMPSKGMGLVLEKSYYFSVRDVTYYVKSGKCVAYDKIIAYDNVDDAAKRYVKAGWKPIIK